MAKWQSPSPDANYLRSIKITPKDPDAHTPGLRGITDIYLEFHFPVTVLVGPNGSGKSTLLNLSALAFRGDSFVPSNRQKPGYRFPDFFYALRSEVQPTNFSIEWAIHSQGKLKKTTMHRTSTRKWMDYERRHEADVLHIGLDRISSWSESGSHKRAFTTTASPQATDHAVWVAEAMTEVFDRKYIASDSMTARRLSVPRVQRADSVNYSGFNMGTGEAAVIAILEEAERLPAGSLLLIEEIEMAIHPSAQANLAKVLQARALKKNLQIICTSHSRWFIDALPRAARILVQPSPGQGHKCIPHITTRLAEGVLLDSHEHELVVICEDVIAKTIIEAALSLSERKRIRIIPYGAKTELCRAASYLRMSNRDLPLLIVWDGDVSKADIREAYKTADGTKNLSEPKRISWTRIGPKDTMNEDYVHSSDDAPERHIKNAILASQTAISFLAQQLSASEEEMVTIIQSSAVSSSKHHELFYDVQRKTDLSLDFVTGAICKTYVQILRDNSVHELPVVDSIRRMLAGDYGEFIVPSGDHLAKL